MSMGMNRVPPEGTLLKRQIWSPAAHRDVLILGIYMGCHSREPRPHVVFWFWPTSATFYSGRHDEQTLMLFSRA